jgi:hypothetical protein
MTPGDLKTQLQQKYQVISFDDLADINQTHSFVYKIFQRNHKDYFDSNERIVFYSEHLPSNQLLQHIQNAANLIDISSCFIMICSPHDISSQLHALSHDSNSIEYYSVNVSSKPLKSDVLYQEDSLCPLPWMHLAVMNLGDCKPCCVSTQSVGSCTNQSLNDLFYNEHMESLRQSMINGQRPDGCSHCWILDDQNLKSNRQWHMEFYGKKFYTEWLDDPAMRSIDFRPSNICNFKCRICNPDSSSLTTLERLQLSKDSEQIIKLKNINAQGRWFDDDSAFIDQIISLLPALINIEFYGGEPFLLKQLPKFLQHAIDSGHAKNIKLHFNTNGSVFPDSLLKYFTQFKQIDIAISIDNIGTRFEFERGGDWSSVEDNVRKFSNQPNLDISIMPTVNIQNVLYLEDIIQWANTNNYRIVFNYLDGPAHFNIENLTDAAKELVISKYQNHSHPELKNISNRIKNSTGSDGKQFIDHMKTLDRHRKQSFLDSHYEIAIAMGYTV